MYFAGSSRNISVRSSGQLSRQSQEDDDCDKALTVYRRSRPDRLTLEIRGYIARSCE